MGAVTQLFVLLPEEELQVVIQLLVLSPGEALREVGIHLLVLSPGEVGQKFEPV